MAHHFITTVFGVLYLVTALYAQRSVDYSTRNQTDVATGSKPDICQNATFNTITRTEDGTLYAFQGDWYWKVISNFTAEGYPKRISRDWVPLPGNLDASFTDSDNYTYFFKDNLYWRFRNRIMDAGYPKLISKGFKGIPDKLDAALTWRSDDKLYFFKGSEYWLYDMNNDQPINNDWYPKSIDDWEGLPDQGIDAAYEGICKSTFFFKGTHYYAFEENSFQMSTARTYPASTARKWFHCPVA